MKKKKLLAGLLSVALAVPFLAGGANAQAKSSDQWDAIKKEGKIVVGTESSYSPYAYHDDDNNLTGYDVEVAKAVAGKLGVDIDFVDTNWDGLIAGLDAKKYDIVMDQVTITDEREEKYLFSTPYTYTYGTLIVAKDNDDIKSFKDLKGKKSAQTTTSNWAEVAKDNGAEIVGTDGFDESIQLVEQGRADATINDNTTFLDYQKKQSDDKVKVAATDKDPSRSAVLIRKKGGKRLQKKINKALKELKDDGTLKEISEKYFNDDVSVKKD